jgi:arylsulfatase A-like enzyme/Flp pilus assembly protein TadD
MLLLRRNSGLRQRASARAVRRSCRFFLLIAAVLVTAACERRAPVDSEAGTPERIVLVTIDTLRADRLGCYGASWAWTPTLDRLAETGVRFANVAAPTPLTQPSHATLFTALEPPQHGMRVNGTFTLADDLPTLAERLRAAGYETAGFVGSVILASHYGFGRGFDHFDDRMEKRQDGSLIGAIARPADAVVDSAVSWLATAPERFFLWIHLYDPHEPYQAPGVLRRLLSRTAYDAEINFADDQLGRLFEAIEDLLPRRPTLIAVTSDHGESLGEHGEESHGYGIYEATQRVPLLIAGAGLPSGTVVEPLVRLSDLAPTILALVGAPALEGVSGRNLRPLWEGGDQTSRVSFLETLAPKLHFGWSPLLGVRTERYKYIRAPRPELYDLEVDPSETRDLAAELPDTAAELDEMLQEHLADRRAPSWATPDPIRREQLEQLGYLVPAPPAASEDLERIEGPDPKDHMKDLVAFGKAAEFMGTGQPRAALQELAKIQVESPYVASLRAEAALAVGRPRLAERHARASLRAGTIDHELHVTLGNALLQQNRLAEAEKAFQEAARIYPSGPQPLIGLGLVAEGQGRRDAAENFYRRASETRGVSTEARWLLAAIYIEKGHQDRAQPLLEELAPQVLHHPMAAARLAVAEARAGRRDEALDRLADARRYSPESPLLGRARAIIDKESQTGN